MRSLSLGEIIFLLTLATLFLLVMSIGTPSVFMTDQSLYVVEFKIKEAGTLKPDELQTNRQSLTY